MNKFILGMLLTFSFNASAEVCEEIRTAFLKTIKSGASVQTISKGADQIYPIVSTSGKGSHCRYIRYSFRTLKKPYNGDSVTPKEWDRAIQQLVNRQ